MTPGDNFREIRRLDARLKKIEKALSFFCSETVEKAESEKAEAVVDMRMALKMLRSKCKWCAEGIEPVDHNTYQMADYHYYSTQPCALTKEERELVWKHLRNK